MEQQSGEKVKSWLESSFAAVGKTVTYVCPDGHVTEWVCPTQIPPDVPCTMILEIDSVKSVEDFAASPICGKTAVPCAQRE